MGKQYGGILALVGCTTVLIRQWLHGDSFEHTMWMTIGGLIVYGFIGFLIGKIAEFTIMESVRATVRKEITAQSDSAHHIQHP